MKHRLVFLPLAKADAVGTIKWYDRQVPGLGRAFLAELRQQAQRIAFFPDSYPKLNATCRRAHLQRFPYVMVYRVLPSVIQVVAILHDRSDPELTSIRALPRTD